MQARRVLFLATALACCYTPMVMAEDALKADPKHYSLVTENDQVRVLKGHYGPHEKSVMHSHPNAVAVFLSSAKGRFNYPDGKAEDFAGKLGDVQYITATTHLPENTGDQAFDVIVIELKGKAAK